eukprot:tig00021692_g23135.t1
MLAQSASFLPGPSAEHASASSSSSAAGPSNVGGIAQHFESPPERGGTELALYSSSDVPYDPMDLDMNTSPVDSWPAASPPAAAASPAAPLSLFPPLSGPEFGEAYTDSADAFLKHLGAGKSCPGCETLREQTNALNAGWEGARGRAHALENRVRTLEELLREANALLREQQRLHAEQQAGSQSGAAGTPAPRRRKSMDGAPIGVACGSCEGSRTEIERLTRRVRELEEQLLRGGAGAAAASPSPSPPPLLSRAPPAAAVPVKAVLPGAVVIGAHPVHRPTAAPGPPRMRFQPPTAPKPHDGPGEGSEEYEAPPSRRRRPGRSPQGDLRAPHRPAAPRNGKRRAPSHAPAAPRNGKRPAPALAGAAATPKRRR